MNIFTMQEIYLTSFGQIHLLHLEDTHSHSYLFYNCQHEYGSNNCMSYDIHTEVWGRMGGDVTGNGMVERNVRHTI